MSKNIFDGLSPLAGFATKLFSNAGLDLAALMTAGNADALKLHLETIAKPVDLAGAITEATNKLQGDLTAATTELTTAKATLGVAMAKIATVNAALAANGIDLAKVEFKAGDASANTAAVKDAMKLTIATAARTELARHGINTPLPEPTPGADPTKTSAKKPGADLTGAAKVQALFAADPLIAQQTAAAAARR